jgi:hypothetical protein
LRCLDVHLRLLVTSRPSVSQHFDDQWAKINLHTQYDDICRYVSQRVNETSCRALKNAINSKELSIEGIAEQVAKRADGM